MERVRAQWKSRRKRAASASACRCTPSKSSAASRWPVYLSGLGQVDFAIHELDQAIACAREHGLMLQESQAHLAPRSASCPCATRHRRCRRYVLAGQTAEAAKVDALAIEAWRLAGHVSLQHGDDDGAVHYFQQAIRVAQDGDATVAQNSSGPEAARQFAELCTKRGLTAQAQSLYDLADRIEGGGSAEPVAIESTRR